MVAEQKHVLISYDDNSGINQQKDYQTAQNLRNNLGSKGMSAEVKGYSKTTLNPTIHQWLIFIPSQDIFTSPQMKEVIDSALTKVVEREMEGVLAVTTSTIDLPAKWASIRTYDSTSQNSEAIWRAMQYAKIPYEKAVARQSRPLVGAYATRRAPQRVLAIAIILGMVLLLGVGAFAYTNVFVPMTQSKARITKQQTATATNKAHATAKANANATGTAVAQLTPKVTPTLSPNELKTRQAEFANLQQNPTIDGFQDVNQWQQIVTDIQGCTTNNAGQYVTEIKTPSHYYPCMEKQTSYTNFALQVSMNIKGDAGGIIFRSDDGPINYYRLSINQADKVVDTFSLYLCNADCLDYETNQGTKIVSETHTVDRTKPITFIIQGQNIDLFIDGKYLTRFSEPTSNTAPTKGQIGFYGASLGQDTIVTWSNLKVWSLDKNAK